MDAILKQANLQQLIDNTVIIALLKTVNEICTANFETKMDEGSLGAKNLRFGGKGRS